MSGTAKVELSTKIVAPVLVFTHEAFTKAMHMAKENLVGNTVFEMSAIGLMDPNNGCRLVDFYVPKQKNTPGTTVMDPESINDLTQQLMDAGISPSVAALWFHTHGNSGVFWSSTDLDTINNFQADGIQWAVVMNAAGHIKIQANVWSPIRMIFADCVYKVEWPTLDHSEWFAEESAKLDQAISVMKTQTQTTPYQFNHQHRQVTPGPQSIREGALYIGVTPEEAKNTIGFALPSSVRAAAKKKLQAVKTEAEIEDEDIAKFVQTGEIFPLSNKEVSRLHAGLHRKPETVATDDSAGKDKEVEAKIEVTENVAQA